MLPIFADRSSAATTPCTRALKSLLHPRDASGAEDLLRVFANEPLLVGCNESFAPGLVLIGDAECAEDRNFFC